MDANQNEDRPIAGFMSADGFLNHLDTINTINLEYAGYSLSALRVLLQKNEKLECYEKCAVIRDEIFKRER